MSLVPEKSKHSPLVISVKMSGGMGGLVAAKSFAKKLRRRSIHGQDKSSQERKTQYLRLPFAIDAF